MGIGMRRLASVLVMILIWTTVPGCGGDGGSDPTALSPGPQSPPQTPNNPPPSPTVGANEPPPTGIFGGGQGKILFAEGRNFPQSVSELDLVTRRIRTVAEVHPSLSFRIDGGVTRANDGTFAVAGRDISEPLAKTIVYHFQANGTQIHGWILSRIFFQGGAISPDAKSVALAERTVGAADRLEVVILDLQSGDTVTHDLLGPNDSPRDKTNLHASALWSSTGELYVISEVGLHRVDRATGIGTLVHSIPLARPLAPTMSPDRRTIYFDQLFGNPRGGTIWSMDVATGSLTRRSVRSQDGDQFSPTVSPDGEWILLQEVDLGKDWTIAPPPVFTPNPLGGSLSLPFIVSAVKAAEPPHDTQQLKIGIRDASSQVHSASGRMVWY